MSLAIAFGDERARETSWIIGTHCSSEVAVRVVIDELHECVSPVFFLHHELTFVLETGNSND